MRLQKRCFGFARLEAFRALTICAVIAVTAAWPAAAQVNFDRPGGDYTSTVIKPADPALCAARCERDSKCQAWAFRYPTSENPAGACWLKNTVPARVEDDCCASGVRGAGVIEPRGGKVEYSTDRWGGDYRNFDLPPSPNGEVCRAACEADAKCRAWTYQRPGYFGATLSARCYLKSSVKPPRRRYYGISGVVR
jgi:hypothetical protein